MFCVRWISGVLGLVWLLAGPAAADPVLVSSRTPLGGGLVQFDVSVDFADGQSRSGFIDIDFSGSFSSSSLETASWPDLQDTQQGATSVHLRGGTGGGSGVQVVPVATLVVPLGSSVTYSGVASRGGENFVLVPEPGSALVGTASLAVVAWLAAAARRRGAA